MRISHVFRGDEHVNNTPWQINIFRLGAPLPSSDIAHHPGDDGPSCPSAVGGERHRLRRQRLSARGDAELPGPDWAGAMATTSYSPPNRWWLVRWQSPLQESRPVGPAKLVGQCPPSSRPTTGRLASPGRARLGQEAEGQHGASGPDGPLKGPLRHQVRRWPNGSACTSTPRSATLTAPAPDRRCPPAVRCWRSVLMGCRPGTEGIAPSRKACLRRVRSQNAATRDTRPRAGVDAAQTPSVDAVLALFDKKFWSNACGPTEIWSIIGLA